MCGVAGILGGAAAGSGGSELAERMIARLRHRGPDDRGTWCDPEDAVALGHARLSILDLSPLGHQPMQSADGRWVISFNGEIYNFRELAAELMRKGHAFKGGSDTEVLLAAVSEWGPRQALERAEGMFALALWDRRDKELRLARDRMGEKPLFWGRTGGGIVFASELKPFLAVPGFPARVSSASLAMLMRFNYIPSPHCIYEDAWKVRPGEILTFALRGGVPETIAAERYWDMHEVAERGRREPFHGSFEEAASELEGLLRTSVRRQMVADVPLGAFLSGGVDSSTIAALMRESGSGRVRTFSIGFEWDEFDESGYAREVARHLGTDHTDLRVTAREATEVIPRLPELYDEPFADSSQIPTYLLCRMARRDVTVALTGDGADELFFGYNRYFRGMRLWSALERIPSGARQAMRAVGSLPGLEGIGNGLGGAAMLPRTMRRRWETAWRRTQLVLSLSGARAPEDFYLGLVSHEREAESLVGGAHDRAGWTAVSQQLSGAPLADAMMYCDMLQYLPDDILVKVDRASMGVSLETRVPFLDHRICEFAWSLPIGYKYREGQGGKLVLKRVLSKFVPTSLYDRPKMGFTVPIVHWLRKECRDWAESLLGESDLKEAGFEDPAPILRHWRRHQSGVSESQFYLWNVLAYMGWRASAKA